MSENTVSEKVNHKKEELLLLAGILCLGVALRIFGLVSRGIWYDDAFSILLSKQSLPAIFSGTAADTMPPLYYLLLHFWMKVSQSIAWMRLLNLFLFLLLQWTVYQWVKELSTKRAAYIVVFFTATAPFLIYHTHEIRMYMLLALCQTAYFFFFTRWFSAVQSGQNNFSNAILMLVCGSAALYTHNLAVFGLIIPGIYLLMRRHWKLFFQWGLFLLGSMLLFLPWLVYVPGQIEKIQTAFWTPRPGLLEIIQSVYSLLSILPQSNPWTLISGVLIFQFLVLLFLEAYRQRFQIKFLGLLMLGIGILPLLLFIISYLMRPVYVARGFILSLVLIYILAAILCTIHWRSGFAKIIIGMLVIISGISLAFYYPVNSFPRSPFKDACAYLNQQADHDPNRLILHDNKLSYFPCVVYQPQLNQAFIGDEPGTHNDTLAYASQEAMHIFPVKSLETAVKDKQEVYFVVFTRALAEYEDMALGEYPALVTLSSQYTLQSIINFNDLAVYHYVKQAP